MDVKSDAWIDYAKYVSFWSVIAVPVLEYFLYAIKDSSDGFIGKVLGKQLKYLTCMIHTISVEVVLKIIYAVLQLTPGFETDIMLIRCLRQVLSLVIYIAVVRYITFQVSIMPNNLD